MIYTLVDPLCHARTKSKFLVQFPQTQHKTGCLLTISKAAGFFSNPAGSDPGQPKNEGCNNIVLGIDCDLLKAVITSKFLSQFQTVIVLFISVGLFLTIHL